MIPILIDTSEVTSELGMTQNQIAGLVEYVIGEMTGAFYEKWVTLAEKTLKGTRDSYVRSIYVGNEGRFTGVVTLRGVFPNMLEQGAGAFDMKKGFSQSDKKKISLSGDWYLTVPFRWATPGALGESSAFSNVMPSAVYSVVKKKQSGTSILGGKTSSSKPVNVNELPSIFQLPSPPKTIILKSKRFEDYQHKTSIYVGIGKSSKTYEEAKQGTYVSFRRVSDKSDEASWIHPAIPPLNLSGKALADLDLRQIVDFSSNAYFNNL